MKRKNSINDGQFTPLHKIPSMKTCIMTSSIILIFGVSIFAQNPNCNRDVWIKQDEKKIPHGICIPKGYLISNIYEMADVNDDGFLDFICRWRRPKLQDGDTLYVTIYAQNRDSTFSHFRTFNNLYPIYFERNNSGYTPPDKKLIPLYEKYRNVFLLKLTFEKGVIQIIRTGEVKENLIITYRYDKIIKNWRYEKTIRYDYAIETKEPYDLSKKLGPTIDNFTYFIWDEEE